MLGLSHQLSPEVLETISTQEYKVANLVLLLLLLTAPGAGTAAWATATMAVLAALVVLLPLALLVVLLVVCVVAVVVVVPPSSCLRFSILLCGHRQLNGRFGFSRVFPSFDNTPRLLATYRPDHAVLARRLFL